MTVSPTAVAAAGGGGGGGTTVTTLQRPYDGPAVAAAFHPVLSTLDPIIIVAPLLL